MNPLVLPDLEAVAAAAAEEIARGLRQAIAARGVAHLALSGGTTPKRTYELLGATPASGQIDWGSVQIWFADERCVPPDHPESNYLMVEQTLLPGAKPPTGNIHRMPGELGPDRGAGVYAADLRAHVSGDPLPVIDVAVLGIGPDGHIASLFPDSPTLEDTRAVCQGIHDSPKPPPQRITLGLGVLQATREPLLIATGPGKASAIAGAMSASSHSVPASLLSKSRLTTIVDRPAAAILPP